MFNEKIYHRKYNKIYYKKNRNKLLTQGKQYRLHNKERIKLHDKERQLKNKDKISEYHKKYYLKNKDKIKEYYSKNKEIINHRYNKYRQKRLRNDVGFKISINLRTRMNKALKRNSKKGSAVKDLGCSIAKFKQYIESKFLHGMSWKNYGRSGWHLDHITPLTRFDLSNRNEFLKACHYTNYQPLWATDNISKGNKL